MLPGVATHITLAQVLVEYCKTSPPKISDLIRVHRLLKKVDLSCANELHNIMANARSDQELVQKDFQAFKQREQSAQQIASVN